MSHVNICKQIKQNNKWVNVSIPKVGGRYSWSSVPDGRYLLVWRETPPTVAFIGHNPEVFVGGGFLPRFSLEDDHLQSSYRSTE